MPTTVRQIIHHGKYDEYEISLNNESGTLDLKSISGFPVSGSIVQVLVKYPDGDDSAGQVCYVDLGGAKIIALDDTNNIFEAFAEVYDRGIIFSNLSSLDLIYNVTVAVTVRLYIDLAPGR